METSSYLDDALTARIIQCVIQVHQTLGPGYVESVYRRALLVELGKQGLDASVEHQVLICYDGRLVGRHPLDLLVEGRVILELKTTEVLSKAHYAQVRSYLKATHPELGLLINFSGERADFRRVVAP